MTKREQLNSTMIELLKSKKDNVVCFPEGTYVTLEFCEEKNEEELHEIYLNKCEDGTEVVCVHTTPKDCETQYTIYTDFSNEEMKMLLDICESGPSVVMLDRGYVGAEDIKRAKQVLIDNGIEADESDTVLQAIGYALLNTELYPYPQCEEYMTH